MKPTRIVIAEHEGNRVYAYRFPCGIVTYNGHRQRHDWVCESLDHVQSFGEDCDAATRAANDHGGHTVLYLDGVRLRPA